MAIDLTKELVLSTITGLKNVIEFWKSKPLDTPLNLMSNDQCFLGIYVREVLNPRIMYGDKVIKTFNLDSCNVEGIVTHIFSPEQGVKFNLDCLSSINNTNPVVALLSKLFMYRPRDAKPSITEWIALAEASIIELESIDDFNNKILQYVDKVETREASEVVSSH